MEAILNGRKSSLMKEVFLKKSLKQFEKQYLDFKKKYKDAKWSIKTIRTHLNKRFLDVKITSKREIGNQIYNLNSRQTVKIETFKNQIKSFEVTIHETTIILG